MGMARKIARYSRKTQEKAMLREQAYQNRVGENANTVAKLLERAEPVYRAEIREHIIRMMFAMSFMALHDEFQFGKYRIMRWYKKMLKLNHELLKLDKADQLNDLLVALKDEYKFDLNEAMEQVAKELEEEWGSEK